MSCFHLTENKKNRKVKKNTGRERREMSSDFSSTVYAAYVHSKHQSILLDTCFFVFIIIVRKLNIKCETFNFYAQCKINYTLLSFFFLHLNDNEKYITEPKNWVGVYRFFSKNIL